MLLHVLFFYALPHVDGFIFASENRSGFETSLQPIISREFSNEVLLFYGFRFLTFENPSAKNPVIILSADFSPAPNLVSLNQRVGLIYFVDGGEPDLVIFGELLRTLDYLRGGKLLVVFAGGGTASTEKIIETGRNWGITRMAFVFWAESARPDFYSWFPFDEENECGRKFGLFRHTSPRGFYKGDGPYDLKNCALTATYFHVEPFVIDVARRRRPGVLVSLFNTIEEVSKMKVRYEHVEAYQDEFLNNGSLMHIFRDLAEGRSDVILGHFFMNSTSNLTEPGPQIYTDELVYVAPKQKKITKYRNIFKAFSYTVWSLYAYAYAFVVIVIVIVRQFYKSRYNIGEILTDLFRLSISSSVHKMPKGSALRVVIIFYTLYSINIDTIYLGKLSSIFTTPETTEKIYNVESYYLNVFHVNVTWYVERLIRLRFFITNVDVGRSFHIVNLTDYEIFRKIALTQANGSIIFRSTIETHPAEAATVEKFISKPHTLYLCYYLRRFNLINDGVVYWTREIMEKGLVKKWWDDIVLARRNYTLIRETYRKPERFVVLTMVHYEQAFLILLFGYLFGLIALVMEFVFKDAEEKIASMVQYSPH